MSYPRVLCLGEILFDCLADRAGLPLEEVQSWTPYPGGAPANVACGLVKLGTAAGFIGCVGSDRAGDDLVQVLQEVGVETAGIQRHPTAPTRQVYVTRSDKGDRTFAGFGETPTTEFADAFLQSNSLPVVWFENADFLVLGTLELAYPQTQDAIAQALNLAEQYNVKVIVDLNWRPMFWPNPDDAKQPILNLLKSADFLKVSDDEAELFFGTTDPGAIQYRIGSLEGVLVTAGDREIAYSLGENEGKLTAFSVEPVDTTGAGDSFVAGFIHQLCQRGINSLSDPQVAQEVVQFASGVGALTTLKPGAIAAQPTLAEVEAFLAQTSA